MFSIISIVYSIEGRNKTQELYVLILLRYEKNSYRTKAYACGYYKDKINKKG